MNQYLQATVTILSLVNPVICASIFSRVTQGSSPGAKIGAATKAMLVVMIILCLAALGGAQLLNVFGISLPAFQVAGGMVLAWMGFIMLRGNSSPTSSAGSQTAETSDPPASSLSPLILFAASPGTMTGVITLAVSHSKGEIPVTALVAVVIALTVTWMVIVLTTRTTGKQEPGLMHDVSSRFMGLIVLAMGVQFALAGLNEFYQSQ